MMKIASLGLGLLLSAYGVFAFAQANTSLSNLSSTAINADLLPGANDSISLGSNSGAEYLGLAVSCGTFKNSKVKVGSCAPDGSNIGADFLFSANGTAFLGLGTPYVRLSSPNTIHLESHSDIILQTGSGNGIVDVNGHLSYAGAPIATISCLTNAGSSATCSNIGNLRDGAGTIVIAPGGSGIAAGTQATIAFGHAYPPSFPICTLTPANSDAGVNAVQAYVTTGNGSSFEINFATAGVSGWSIRYYLSI
jgi:hypothetical protein